jgi:protein-ribulosamine 3-kinase
VSDAAAKKAITSALAGALGRSLRVDRWQAVGGGCISHASRIDTNTGTFFAKWNAEAPPDFFEAEARGLRELGKARSSLAIPAVVAASGPRGEIPAFIVMEYLDPQAAHGAVDEEVLGRGLAELHGASAPRFGFPGDTYCGSTRQSNVWCDTWPEFYAERRLRPLLAALRKARGLSASDQALYEGVVARLPELIPAEAKPSLIHGDLWSGNVLWTTRGPALVDPSCAYGEREMEFGITTLFGGLPPRAWSAYLEASPLPSGWRERNPLYQLYHLLNHYLLFGGGYGAQARDLARGFV